MFIVGLFVCLKGVSQNTITKKQQQKFFILYSSVSQTFLLGELLQKMLYITNTLKLIQLLKLKCFEELFSEGLHGCPMELLQFTGRMLKQPGHNSLVLIISPISGQTSDLYQQNLFPNILYTPKITKLGYLNF